MSLEKIVFGSARFEAPVEEKPVEKPRAAAWVDPDDLADSISLPSTISETEARAAMTRLSEKYDAIMENVDKSWANPGNGPQADGDASDIFGRRNQIPSDTLVISRISDLYNPKTAKFGIYGIEFNPATNEAVVLDQKDGSHVVSVNGKQNFAMPVIPFSGDGKRGKSVCYTADGEYIIVGGQLGNYQTIDCRVKSTRQSHLAGERNEICDVKCSPTNKIFAMIAGNTIHFMDVHSRQQIREIRTNIDLNCGAFTSDGLLYIACGREGKGIVIECDDDEMCVKPRNQFREPEMQEICAIDIRGNRVAIGTDAGVMHMFELSELRQEHPAPVFSKMNLTTKIDTVCFNHTGELLAFGSSGKKDSLRILHVAARKVFDNWPTQRTPISFLRDAAFDRTGQWLALANDKGVVSLWELGFYKDKL